MLFSLSITSQNIESNGYPYRQYFQEAYQLHPDIPKGLLEAIAWTQTHIDHKTLANTSESCTGMPFGWGSFGLVEDGKNWFRNNLITVSQLSGYTTDQIKNDERFHILAYAAAFEAKKNQMGITSQKVEELLPVIVELSELHLDNTNSSADFSINSFLYSILTFLNDEKNQDLYEMPAYNISLKKTFGANNLNVLSSPKIQMSEHGIITHDGVRYILNTKVACPDYNVPHCSWVASPNYSSRAGTPISVVVMHTVQGSYAGCVSWFQNPTAQASTAYVVRSSDGQLTQMVLEADKAWHVGSENPYSIGYEHEGYVEQTGWYTMPMYQSSADLTRDICQAYGINPERMFFRDTLDNGTALDFDIHTLAGATYCTKIAGHQHLPNQTHSDPGPNWVWDTYYKLVNNTPVITTLTSASGSFYDSGGAGANYADDERKVWTIQPAGASSITLNFTSFDVEADYDFMYIYDGPSVWSPKIGRFNTTSPGTITSSGGALTIEFRSDCATNATGWVANWTSLQPDATPPTTTISTPNNWKTADFTATFTDNDNTSVEKAFYQVLDFDGTNWGANSANGFYADNFDALQPSWTNYSGVWNVSAGELIQSDETQANSNIYASLNQTLSNRYLYHFVAKANGAGTNRRFGFHFFCDNAALANRGNSYFVWFRIDDQSLQFYKVVNDTFTLVNTISSVVTTPGQQYDYKITYDRISGRVAVWRDDAYIGSWTDPAPYSVNGNYISFRTGNCTLNVNELKVFRSRYPTVTVTLNDNTKDIRFQNPNSSTFGAKIKSIVVDGNNNLSAIAYHDMNVDWTPPSDVSVIDGTTNDIDTIYTTTTATAEWSVSSDPNSGVAEYWYALGTTPGAADVVTWTNNGTINTITLNSLSLSVGSHYYFSVKVKNNADLWSNVISSDGFIVSSLSLPVADFYVFDDTLYLPSANALFYNTSQNAISYLWDFGDGGTSTATNPWHNYTQAGIYNVQLIAMNTGLPNDTLIKNNYVYILNQSSQSIVIRDKALMFPNPFSDEIKINFKSIFSGNISLMDATGRIVRKAELENATFYTINNLNSLEKGIYIIELSQAGGGIQRANLIRR